MSTYRKLIFAFIGFFISGLALGLIGYLASLQLAAFVLLAGAFAGDNSSELWSVIVICIPLVILSVCALWMRQPGLFAGCLVAYLLMNINPRIDLKLETPSEELKPQSRHQLIGLPGPLSCGVGCLAFLDASPTHGILLPNSFSGVEGHPNLSIFRPVAANGPCRIVKGEIELPNVTPIRCLAKQTSGPIEDALILEYCSYDQRFQYHNCFFKHEKPEGVSSVTVDTVYEIIGGKRTILSRHYAYYTGGFPSLTPTRLHEKGLHISTEAFETMVFGPTEGQVRGNSKYTSCKPLVPCTNFWR